MDEKEPSLDFSGDKVLKYAKQKQNVIIKYSKNIVHFLIQTFFFPYGC